MSLLWLPMTSVENMYVKPEISKILVTGEVLEDARVAATVSWLGLHWKSLMEFEDGGCKKPLKVAFCVEFGEAACIITCGEQFK